jgi:hypothetical protein
VTKARDLKICAKCGWYAHGPYDGASACDPAAGDAVATVMKAVPEVPSTKLGYGRGSFVFESDEQFHIRLEVDRRPDRAAPFRLRDVWLIDDLTHDDVVDLVRTLVAWRGRQIDRRKRAEMAAIGARATALVGAITEEARKAGWTIEHSESHQVDPAALDRWSSDPAKVSIDVAAASDLARDIITGKAKQTPGEVMAIAVALVKLYDEGPRTVVVDRPNEYDPPTEAELERSRRNVAARQVAENRHEVPSEIILRLPKSEGHAPPVAGAWESDGWLAKIEALKPGDACEFHYSARKEWLRGTIVKNGGGHWWSVCDETDVEGRRGKVQEGLYIEQIRLPGQTEAWPR